MTAASGSGELRWNCGGCRERRGKGGMRTGGERFGESVRRQLRRVGAGLVVPLCAFFFGCV